MELNYKLISNVSFEDIDYSDAPDFVDAFLTSADYDGEPMTDEMLNIVNDDSDLVYELLLKYLY